MSDEKTAARPNPAFADPAVLNGTASSTASAFADPAPGAQAQTTAEVSTPGAAAVYATPVSTSAASSHAAAVTPEAAPHSIPSMMQAVRMRDYGGPNVLVYEQTPVPTPDDNEVLIRVQAAGVNPLDVKIREGAMKDLFSLPLPAVLGTDVAGVVVAVGKAVSSLKPGQHVYGVADMAKGGSYAQYAIAQAGAVAHKPGILSAVECASVPVVAMTAWQALHDIAHIQPYHKVLIHGAGGMVGLFAIQFAKRAGAHVVALSKHENTSLMRELGADTVLDYTHVPFEQHISGIDIALDTIGGDIREKTWRTLAPGGMLVTTTDPPAQETADKYGVRATMVNMKPSGFLLGDFGQWLNAGELRTVVGRVYPLEQAAAAQEAVRNREAHGKVVLNVGS